MTDYDETKLTKLAHLKSLAQKIKDDYATKAELNSVSGTDANKIEVIKVNGTAQEIVDKAVNISVPTNTNQLTNGSDFQNSTQVSTAIQTAISAAGHASFKVVESVPDPTEAQTNILYLVKRGETTYYDIYAKIGEQMVLIDDTTVDLSNYATKTELDSYVKKDGSKVLSTNDYTTEEKNKLGGLQNYTVFTGATAEANGAIGLVPAPATTDLNKYLSSSGKWVGFSAATSSSPGVMSAADKSKLDSINVATDEEVAAMITEVFA